MDLYFVCPNGLLDCQLFNPQMPLNNALPRKNVKIVFSAKVSESRSACS